VSSSGLGMSGPEQEQVALQERPMRNFDQKPGSLAPPTEWDGAAGRSAALAARGAGPSGGNWRPG
jgi:hypothetical protein